MNKKILKLGLPFIASAFVITSCSGTGGLAGKKFIVENSTTFVFENGLTEDSFFGPNSEFHCDKSKQDMIDRIKGALYISGDQSLGFIYFTDEPAALKGWYALNKREISEHESAINNIYYRVNGGKLEFRTNNEEPADLELHCGSSYNPKREIDYSSMAHFYFNPSTIDGDKINLNFKFDFVEKDYLETKIIREAHATFTLTANRTN